MGLAVRSTPGRSPFAGLLPLSTPPPCLMCPMPLCSIAYCSDLAEGLTLDQVNALVRDASHHNRLAGVTGVLLCDGDRFLQYMEGPQDGINFVYSRVLNSRRHSNVVELARGHGGIRRFPYWSMHWIPVDQHELHAAAVADWTSMKVHRTESSIVVPGLEKLAALVAPHLKSEPK